MDILKRHLNTDQEQQAQQQQTAEGQQQLQQQTREQPTHNTRQLQSHGEHQRTKRQELRDGTEWYEDEPWVVYFDHVMEKLGPDAKTSDYYDGEFKVNPLGMFGSRRVLVLQ